MWNSRNKVHYTNIAITTYAEFDQNYEIDIENLPVAKPSQPIFLKYIENEVEDTNIVVLIFCIVMV